MAGFDLSHELFRAAYDIAFYSGVHPNFYFLILNKHWVYSRIIFFRPPEDPENENYQALTARLWPQYLVDNLFDCFEKLHFRSKYLYALCQQVQDREKEDAFPLYFEDMMTGHWAASYYR